MVINNVMNMINLNKIMLDYYLTIVEIYREPKQFIRAPGSKSNSTQAQMSNRRKLNMLHGTWASTNPKGCDFNCDLQKKRIGNLWQLNWKSGKKKNLGYGTVMEIFKIIWKKKFFNNLKSWEIFEILKVWSIWEREREREKKTFEKFGKIWNFGPKSGDIKKIRKSG